MGILSGSMESLSRSKSRSKSDAGLNDASRPSAGGSAAMHESASMGGASMSGGGEDTTNLDKDQGNVLMSIIQQRG